MHPQRSHLLVILLFAGAGIGLASQILTAPTIAPRCLAITLFILCLDQTRMAIVDLTHIHQLQTPDTPIPALQRFTLITWSTIGLELAGFYLSWQWLGWGSAVVLLSQLWFNLFAGVQLVPDATPPIQPWGIRDRAIVLVADTVGLALSILYARNIQPLGMAIGLLSMVLIYGLIKYWPSRSVPSLVD
jgi:hypothetical protein